MVWFDKPLGCIVPEMEGQQVPVKKTWGTLLGKVIGATDSNLANIS